MCSSPRSNNPHKQRARRTLDLPFCLGSRTAFSGDAHPPASSTPMNESTISRWCSSSRRPTLSANVTTSGPSDDARAGTHRYRGGGEATVTIPATSSDALPPTAAGPSSDPPRACCTAHVRARATSACRPHARDPIFPTARSTHHTGSTLPRPTQRPPRGAHVRADAQSRNPRPRCRQHAAKPYSTLNPPRNTQNDFAGSTPENPCKKRVSGHQFCVAFAQDVQVNR
jgi:hypothetical protein